ncbi:hypothetical protein CMV_004793 [Castanea mollissima]|uniref:Uncharacterized protein n=1 Tax=Castanea mollissima TaxID=60419 RepID=A0A8J4RNJ9_9ROSI|nr:hypothetical protein CMV_004793 [Castanea mollissima]
MKVDVTSDASVPLTSTVAIHSLKTWFLKIAVPFEGKQFAGNPIRNRFRFLIQCFRMNVKANMGLFIFSKASKGQCCPKWLTMVSYNSSTLISSHLISCARDSSD